MALVNGSIQEKNRDKYTFGTFEKYTADLGVIAKNTVRYTRPEELGIIDLILSKRLGYASDLTYPKYLVECHKRLIQPFYNIIFTLIALLSIFKFPLNKRSNSKNMIIAVSSMVGFQMLYMSMFNLIRVHLKFYPLVYIFTLVAIVVMLKILYSNKKFTIKRFKSKNEE